MKLYVYDTGSKSVLLELDQVTSYTDRAVVTEKGICGPFAEDCELSSLPDCSETLRADWRAQNPSQESRLEDVEALLAELLFGGEAV